jgi:uncharacterized protein (TIRG00374 family)
MSILHFIKRLFRAQVILPLILGAAVLLGLLAFGDVRKILALMESFQHVYLLYFLLLMVAYEILRCAEWHFMLLSLGIRVPLRTQVFTFITGEVSKDLPVGNFIPDYVLQRSQGTDFGLASSATLLITLMEVAVSLTGVVIIGIDGWNWLRPLILVGTFVAALVAWALYRWYHVPHQHPPRARIQRLLRWRIVRTAMDELRQFLRGEATLMHPHVLGIGSALAAAYLIIGGSGVYLVLLGLGLSQVSWWQALAVYFFSIAFAAIVPLPMDFGSVELSGTGALVAMGLGPTDAVSVMLINRVLSFGATIAIALIVTAILHRELAAALRARPRAAPPSPQVAPPSDPAMPTPQPERADGARAYGLGRPAGPVPPRSG